MDRFVNCRIVEMTIVYFFLVLLLLLLLNLHVHLFPVAAASQSLFVCLIFVYLLLRASVFSTTYCTYSISTDKLDDFTNYHLH